MDIVLSTMVTYGHLRSRTMGEKTAMWTEGLDVARNGVGALRD